MDIFNNPMIKRLALGKLKSYMKENNIQRVIVSIDPETEEINFDPFKKGECFILNPEQMKKYTDLVTNKNSEI